MNWSLQNIAAVIFSAPVPVPPPAFDVWTRVGGAPPSSYNQNPPGMPPGSQAAGEIEGQQVAVMSQPGRIDIAINPAPPSGPGDTPPVLEFAPAKELVLRLAKKLAGGDHPLRIAIVANCIQYVETSDEAVRLFTQATRLQDVPTKAMDLSFAINLRRSFGAAGWEMNRLCRWATGQMQFVEFHLSGPDGMAGAPRVSIVKHMASLTIDVNTVLRHIPLGNTQAVAAFDELASEVEAIMSVGYERLTA